jgi:hypothetical protein
MKKPLVTAALIGLGVLLAGQGANGCSRSWSDPELVTAATDKEALT